MFIFDILKIGANIIYLPFKLLKTRNKVTFISRQSNRVSLEFDMIMSELGKENIEIVAISKKLEYTFKSLICNLFLFFKQMYHIATSKIVIINGYCVPISILKHKKKLIVIQTWHANGIIKKIGLQTLYNKSRFQRKLALKMNMHKNYDYVLSSSDMTSKVYLKAFDIKKNNILKFGTPILDYLYRGQYKEKEHEIRTKYKLGKKKNVVYMPTLRENDIILDDLVNNFDFNKYNLILKVHPVQKVKNIDRNVIEVKGYSGEELLSIADYVISDYSNIAIEAILIGKPVLFYLYDLKQYRKKPGLNVNLMRELPNNTFVGVKLLSDRLNKGRQNLKPLHNFARKHIETYDGQCTKRMVDFVIQQLKS